MGVKVKESKAWVELKGVVLGDGEFEISSFVLSFGPSH